MGTPSWIELCLDHGSRLSSVPSCGVGRNTQVRRNYTTPHKTQMIDTTINLLVNRDGMHKSPWHYRCGCEE